eukprot:TRINITY_DN11718_c0_g1_i1.p1 TRINITY_DN11718_c0_g1~~TRINITY_DN11718_c0_g1_i1.p1  ORF type:complete len:117 (+),score=0.36 TRINITY_DN11718_c0_g1_i1:120-470(+)
MSMSISMSSSRSLGDKSLILVCVHLFVILKAFTHNGTQLAKWCASSTVTTPGGHHDGRRIITGRRLRWNRRRNGHRYRSVSMASVPSDGRRRANRPEIDGTRASLTRRFRSYYGSE